MPYKKSKSAYLLLIITLIGIAIFDRVRPSQDQVEIVLENKVDTSTDQAFYAKLK